MIDDRDVITALFSCVIIAGCALPKKSGCDVESGCEVESVELIEMNLTPSLWWVSREYARRSGCDAFQVEYWQENGAGAMESYLETVKTGE